MRKILLGLLVGLLLAALCMTLPSLRAADESCTTCSGAVAVTPPPTRTLAGNGPSSKGAAPTEASVPADWVALASPGWITLRTTRGVIDSTSSDLPTVSLLLPNRRPRPGISPSPGILLPVAPWSLRIRPARIWVSPWAVSK